MLDRSASTSPLLVLQDADPLARVVATRVAEGLGLSLELTPCRQALPAVLDPARPAVVLLSADEGLPAALEGLAAIRAQHPACGVILLANNADLRDGVQAIRAGADDFLAKPLCAPLLAAAVEASLARSQQKLRAHPALTMLARRVRALTSREKDVLRALLQGLDIPETATRLRVSVRTVQLRLQQLLRKLECPSRQALLARLLRDPAWRDTLMAAVGSTSEGHAPADPDAELQLLSAGCS